MALVACGTTTPTQTSEASVLAAADAADGTVDKTVSECTSCGLGMPGNDAYTVEHDGYELHFCSETCKANFEQDPEAGMKKLETAVKSH